MELLALLTNRDEIVTAVRNCLKGYSIYPVKNISELNELLISSQTTALILDGFTVKPSQVEEIMSGKQVPILLLIDEGFNQNKLSQIPETIDVRDIFKALPKTVERIIDKKRLENEIKTLRVDKSRHHKVSNDYESPHIIDSSGKRLLHEHVLLNFAKTLAVNFDLKKLLNHFMDSVMEITRTNKMSILLREKNIFKIKAYTGIDPYYAENIKLTNESFLIKWLASNGRILSRSLNTQNDIYPKLIKEMELLQCIFSFPIINKGKLIGVFNIGSKITSDPFYKEELEIIFMLCNYLSAAIKDIESYHQIQYQKEFTKNILSNMNSGVITINLDERISVFNQRASEILKLNAMEVLGSDLRKLPSPLGDILYETMVEGKSYSRHEIIIKPGNIPLGINSYRFIDENNTPMGAVIVFTDLSDLKRLEEEKRKAEKLEAINNLIGKIAHEIKNPLTSIQTFTQLLEDKYADEEFRKFFSLSVMQSIQQLTNLIDKLVLFSSPLDYHLSKYNVKEIIDEVANTVWKDMPPGVRLLKENLDRDLYIKVDRDLFIKSLCYLILASAEKSPKDDYVLLQAIAHGDKPDSIEILIKFLGKPFTEEEKEMLLRPLLDIDAFGIELNIPLSQKIIDEHNGTLTITSNNEGNALIITMPATEKSDITVQKDNIFE